MASQTRNNLVTPVTISQIKRAGRGGDESFTVDGRELSHVSVMGVVRSFEVKETKFVCNIEDHTGRS